MARLAHCCREGGVSFCRFTKLSRVHLLRRGEWEGSRFRGNALQSGSSRAFYTKMYNSCIRVSFFRSAHAVGFLWIT